jgi:hypothetical protein
MKIPDLRNEIRKGGTHDAEFVLVSEPNVDDRACDEALVLR